MVSLFTFFSSSTGFFFGAGNFGRGPIGQRVASDFRIHQGAAAFGGISISSLWPVSPKCAVISPLARARRWRGGDQGDSQGFKIAGAVIKTGGPAGEEFARVGHGKERESPAGPDTNATPGYGSCPAHRSAR